MSKQPKLGPTGQFPQGMACPKDEGEIQLMIGRTPDGTIIMDFGGQTAWIGMTPQQARDVANKLLESAKQADEEAH